MKLKNWECAWNQLKDVLLLILILNGASGKKVYEGAVANNCLKFGSKVEIGGKIYTVEDRMNKRYGCDHFDIFVAEKSEAIAFGRKNLEYKVLD